MASDSVGTLSRALAWFVTVILSDLHRIIR